MSTRSVGSHHSEGSPTTEVTRQFEDLGHTSKDSVAESGLIDQRHQTVQPHPPPPPNGGFVAWLQCANTFCLWFAAWGLVNSFGVFQEYYETIGLAGSSSSKISWIGSLQLCIFIAGTSIIGPIFDLGFLRSLLVTGAFLTVFGMMMTSLCNEYWQFILAQGLCMGVGMTCLFVPCVAVLPPYFTSRRALAMGLGASGSSIGKLDSEMWYGGPVAKV